MNLYNPYVFTLAPILYINYILDCVISSNYDVKSVSASVSADSKSIINYVRVYNIMQIALCSYMTYGLFPIVSNGITNPFGINTPYNDRLEWFTNVHYLSKYFDWIDIFIIIKRQKASQLSFLHVYHHSTVSAVWGFMLYMGHGNGTAAFGAWINSLTHVLMYSHYLLTSFNIKNPFKKYLTMWQITQFYLCFTHGIVMLFVYPTWETYLPYKYSWLCASYHTSMIVLFTYYMNYVPTILKLKTD